MNQSTVLRKDGSFDTFTTDEGLPKALEHKAIALNVNTNEWYIYHQRNYNPKATTGTTVYNPDNWFSLA